MKLKKAFQLALRLASSRKLHLALLLLPILYAIVSSNPARLRSLASQQESSSSPAAQLLCQIAVSSGLAPPGGQCFDCGGAAVYVKDEYRAVIEPQDVETILPVKEKVYICGLEVDNVILVPRWTR